MKVVVIEPGKKPEIREIDSKKQLEGLNQCVGGYIETVHWKNGYTCYANEDGISLGLIYNAAVSRNPDIRKRGYDGIVGPLVVMKNRKGKGLTDEECEFVVKEFSQ